MVFTFAIAFIGLLTLSIADECRLVYFEYDNSESENTSIEEHFPEAFGLRSY